jgi:hypothetical protein
MEEVAAILLFTLLILYLISMVNRFTAFDSPMDVAYVYPDEMNNGDLLCVSYNNVATDFVGSFTNSVWVHVGMVWVDPDTNIRYVLEGGMYPGKHYKNFFIIPVDTWMNINKKSLLAIRRYSGPEIDSTQMLHEFLPFVYFSKLEGFNLMWNRFLVNKPYQKPKQLARYTCFESIIIVGQEVGIFSKDKYYTSYFPNDIVNGKIKLCEGVSYTDKIQLCMPDACKNMLYMDMAKYPKFWT